MGLDQMQKESPKIPLYKPRDGAKNHFGFISVDSHPAVRLPFLYEYHTRLDIIDNLLRMNNLDDKIRLAYLYFHTQQRDAEVEATTIKINDGAEIVRIDEDSKVSVEEEAQVIPESSRTFKYKLNVNDIKYAPTWRECKDKIRNTFGVSTGSITQYTKDTALSFVISEKLFDDKFVENKMGDDNLIVTEDWIVIGFNSVGESRVNSAGIHSDVDNNILPEWRDLYQNNINEMTSNDVYDIVYGDFDESVSEYDQSILIANNVYTSSDKNLKDIIENQKLHQMLQNFSMIMKGTDYGYQENENIYVFQHKNGDVYKVVSPIKNR